MTTKDLIILSLGQTKVETNTIYEFMIRFGWGKVEVCRFIKYEKPASKSEDLILNVIRHAGSSMGCCEFEGYIKAEHISDFYDKALMIANSALHQYELKTFKEQKQYDDTLRAIEQMKG